MSIFEAGTVMVAGNVDGNILDLCLGDSKIDKIFLLHIVVDV